MGIIVEGRRDVKHRGPDGVQSITTLTQGGLCEIATHQRTLNKRRVPAIAAVAMYIHHQEGFRTAENMGLLTDTKIVGCACAGNAGNVFPATDFKGNL